MGVVLIGELCYNVCALFVVYCWQDACCVDNGSCIVVRTENITYEGRDSRQQHHS